MGHPVRSASSGRPGWPCRGCSRAGAYAESLTRLAGEGSVRAAKLSIGPHERRLEGDLVLLAPAGLGVVLGQVQVHPVLIDVVDPGDGDQVVLEAAAQVQLGQLDLAADHVVHTAD